MPVDPELLRYLSARPACGVQPSARTGAEVPQCRRVYRDRGQRPVMLIDEATIED
jgi:hypothetical protein